MSRLSPVALLVLCAACHADSWTLLSYNVKGLPPLVMDGDGPARMRAISERMRRYDIVVLQEVFAYDDLLRTAGRSVQWLNGPGPRFRVSQLPALIPLYLPCLLSSYCEMPSSAGLALALHSPAIVAELLTAQAYSTCHGVLRASNDCLATKGWLGVELSFPEGKVHLYTTHLDAGQSPRDRLARQAQLGELTRAILRYSRGQALLVTGDFNLHRSSGDDMGMLTDFLGATGLENTRVFESPRCEFGCLGLDYIMQRSGSSLAILVDAATAGEFVDADGEALSDHPPLTIEFRIVGNGLGRGEVSE